MLHGCLYAAARRLPDPLFDPRSVIIAMTLSARDLRSQLKARRVALSPPASKETLGYLERVTGLVLSPAIRDVYEAFDGFADDDFDAGSFIAVWPIGKILAHLERERLPYIPFADRAFDAERFAMCLSDACAPILDSHGGSVVCADFMSFWAELLASPPL